MSFINDGAKIKRGSAKKLPMMKRKTKNHGFSDILSSWNPETTPRLVISCAQKLKQRMQSELPTVNHFVPISPVKIRNRRMVDGQNPLRLSY
jgi:hypothetical protein